MATHSIYSCLENPRDRGAYCAAVYGVAQSWTQLKRLSRHWGRVGSTMVKEVYSKAQPHLFLAERPLGK